MPRPSRQLRRHQALLLVALTSQALALPLSLGLRLSTISPELDIDLTNPLGPPPTGAEIFGSLISSSGQNLNYAVSIPESIPESIPVLSSSNMFSTYSTVGPASLLQTLQTMLDRLIVSTRFNFGLPAPLAFLVGFTVMFLFVLSSLFPVFLLWHIARKVVRNTPGRERTMKNNGREFVIRSRPITRVVLRPRSILSPAGSRISGSSEGSPCPKRVRWVDEERGCQMCMAESHAVKADADLLDCGIEMEMEMEKAD
jgi:hypothetical protein